MKFKLHSCHTTQATAETGRVNADAARAEG